MKTDKIPHDAITVIEITPPPVLLGRRQAVGTSCATAFSLLTAISLLAASSPSPAHALVKGVAPPPKRSPPGGSGSGGSGGEKKCTNVEECQALAEQREDELRAKEEVGPPPLVTTGGVRYLDLREGDEDGSSSQSQTVAQDGDQVHVFFKVLKLGKRSYDGLSGEGTVVFSRGYGFEDDESNAGDKDFQTIVGSKSNIPALNEALLGMKAGGVRRFAILPQMGWEKAGAACDGGPGGKGAGGDLKTDYVVVPTATMVDQEACFDKSRIPFPSTYAQQRRMAQRFDQSLIMEIQLVSIQR